MSGPRLKSTTIFVLQALASKTCFLAKVNSDGWRILSTFSLNAAWPLSIMVPSR